jgi:transposase
MSVARPKRTLQQENRHLRQQLDQARQTIQGLEEKVRQLEARLASAQKNSATSSKPPSSDVVKPKKNKRSARRSIGGQPGHPQHQRRPFGPAQIAHRKEYAPKHCPGCGSSHWQRLPEPARVVQQVELVKKPFRVTEHTAWACRCQDCGQVHEGQLPQSVLKTGLIGPRLMALLIFMKGALHVSYSGLQEFLEQGLGLTVCRGLLAKVMAKGAQALATPVEQLRQLLPAQARLNVDETGHKENGKAMWTWCFRAKEFVLFTIRASRGSDVLIDLLGQAFAGALGCDYFSAYRKFMGTMSGTVQFCLAHLIRDVKFLAEHPDLQIQLYAQPLLEALRRLFALIHAQVENPRPDFQERLERQKQRIIDLATDTAAVSPIDWYVQKNFPEIVNMAERFRKHGQAYFTFITTPGLDPTNNMAEQAIRFVVIDRHVTQGTRSPKGRTFCERIWTVIATCRLTKRSILQFLSQAVEAWAKNHAAPSLVPADSS